MAGRCLRLTEYLLELVRYTHLNQVRASMVADITHHPWSSHHAHLDSAKQSWVTTDVVLSMFHTGRTRAIAAYRCFIEAQVAITAAAL